VEPISWQHEQDVAAVERNVQQQQLFGPCHLIHNVPTTNVQASLATRGPLRKLSADCRSSAQTNVANAWSFDSLTHSLVWRRIRLMPAATHMPSEAAQVRFFSPSTAAQLQDRLCIRTSLGELYMENTSSTGIHTPCNLDTIQGG
jgi:hypothetical protein